jgi:hypothetical protein
MIEESLALERAGDPPLTYAWTFGDGGTGQGVNVSHRYLAGGDYTVELAATNCGGLGVDTFSHTLTVRPGPCQTAAILSVTAAVSDCTVTLGAELSGDGPFLYLWDLGAFGAYTVAAPQVDFGAGGTYSGTLNVWNCGQPAPAVQLFAVTVACPRRYFLYLPLVRRGVPVGAPVKQLSSRRVAATWPRHTRRPARSAFRSSFHWLIHRAPIDLERRVPGPAGDDPFLHHLARVAVRRLVEVDTAVPDYLLPVHHPVAGTQVCPVALAVLVKGFRGRDLELLLPSLVIQIDITTRVVPYVELAPKAARPLDREAGNSRLDAVHIGEERDHHTVTSRQEE